MGKTETKKQAPNKNIWSKAERSAWSLPQKLTVSEWADKYRILDEKSAAPGQWRTGMTPYLKGIMDAFNDPHVETITVVKVPQSGGTEAFLNMLGYAICEDPGPALLILPRHEEDCGYMAGRLKAMVSNSPELNGHTTGRMWDLMGFEFNFDRMTLYFSGSNSPAGLGTKPIRYLWLDETDKYPPFVGKEASPIDLATKRTITFWDRKICHVSTPTTTNGNIWQMWLKSARHEYYVPCPFCGEYQVLTFFGRERGDYRLKIAKEMRDPSVIKSTPGCVWYECEFCKGRIEEAQKPELISRGEWLPEKHSGEILSSAKEIRISVSEARGQFSYNWRHIGFHFNALISPWISWPEIMAEWFEANTEEGIAIGKFLDFKNAVLAEPYTETVVEVRTEELLKNIGGFSRGQVPDECRILVAGADYHEDIRGQVRIDFEVRGFSHGERNFVISCGSVYSWGELEEEILLHTFPWTNPENKSPELAVVQLFIDSGYKPDEVYSFCQQYRGICLPTKGMAGKQRTPLILSSLEKTSAQRQAKWRGLQIALLDTSFFKDKVHGWSSRAAGEAGSTQFFREIPDFYFREFTNERKTKVKGRFGGFSWQWRPISAGAQVHFLDTAVNAAAAAFYKRVQYIRRADQKETRAIPAAFRREEKRLIRGYKTERGGFLDNLPQL